MNSEPMTPAQDPAPQDPSSTPVQGKRPTPVQSGPRTSPIVWGALILGFCGYVVQRTLAPGNIDTTTWITAVTIGLGVLLLGVGAAVLIRNQRRSTQHSERTPRPE